MHQSHRMLSGTACTNRIACCPRGDRPLKQPHDFAQSQPLDARQFRKLPPSDRLWRLYDRRSWCWWPTTSIFLCHLLNAAHAA